MSFIQKIDIGLQHRNATRIDIFQDLPSYIVHFLPTLMIWMFTIVLPLIISWTDRYLVGHWTRSSENHDIMKKTFW